MLEHKNEKIIVDDREHAVYLQFFELGYKNIDVQRIEIGDFIISERTCVERKGMSYSKKTGRFQHDFVSSIIDSRVFIQASNMSSNYERVIFIIEDWEKLWEDKRVTDEAKMTTFAALATIHGAAIIPTKDVFDTVHTLLKISEKDTEDGYKEPIAKKPKFNSIYKEQVFFISSLPMVGRKRAKQLLEEFGSPMNIMKALYNSEEVFNSKKTKKVIKSEFDSLHGFGETFVRKNKELLTTRYRVPKIL